ncbi:MAG: nucleoside-diphosphate kinase [Phycisphaerae bacterium]|nr:nucleoside-diphosphate kinase [Phycisphaerae bacterium]
MERTLVVVKPDAVQRGLIGEILRRFERKGLKLVALKLTRVDDALARKMYAPHEGKPFYEPLVAFITAGPVVAGVIEGLDAIAVVRGMLGATFGREAQAGTIRGDYGMSQRYNLVHGSDAPDSAEREIALLFDADELLDYDAARDAWVYAEHRGTII